MRVIFVSEPLFPLSGTSCRTINFAKALKERGYEVYIITPRESASPSKNIHGVHIRRLKAFMPQSFGIERRKNFLKFIARGGLSQIKSEIIKLYDLGKPTIVHYVNYYMSLCGILIDQSIQVKSIHDIQASAYYESSSSIDKIFRTYIERVSCSTKNIMVVTDELRNYFIEKYPNYEKKIHVVPLLIDTNFFTRKTDNEIRHKLGLPNNLKYLLVFHGSPYLENIRALEKLKIIMEGLNAKGLASKALVLGFVGKYVNSPHFICCGYVDDLPLYISAADLAVVPVDSRSLGMRTRILEYMACGIPVIAISTGLFGYGKAISKKMILVAQNTEEVISLILSLNSSLKNKMVENALKFIRDYHSPDVIVTKLESVYKEVLET